MIQKLDAKQYESLFLKVRETMPLFETRNVSETMRLGCIFAQAVRGMRDISRAQQRPIRIGLDAISRTGKTSFVRGTLSALAHYKIVVECENEYEQATRRHNDPAKGWIRNYDASLVEHNSLPSYLANDISEFGLPFVDIVEHPSEDEHDREFDCLLFLRQRDLRLPKSPRAISVMATNDILNTAEFQKFLRQAAEIKSDNYRSHLWSPKPIVPRGGAPI